MPATETAPAAAAAAGDATATVTAAAAAAAAAEATAAKADTAGDGKASVGAVGAVEYPVLLNTVVVRDAAAALAWYEKAVGARVVFRYDDKDGRVMHAVVSTEWGLMFGVEDHYPKMHMVRPVGDGGADAAAVGCSYVYVTIPKGKGSADAMIERMREAGATVVMEAQDKFYGQRMGQVVDQFGVAWVFAHKIEQKAEEKVAEPEKKDVEAK